MSDQPSSLPQNGSPRGGLELVVFWRDMARTYVLPEQGEVTIGRAEENVVCIEHGSVSRHHAVLRLGTPIVIRDLGGANGTFLRDSFGANPASETVGLRRLAAESTEVAIGEALILGEVTAVIRKQPDSLSTFGNLRDDQEPESGVILKDPNMRTVYAEAERAAQSPITLLILGETGVGKDLLARAVHARSKRASGPYVSVNCAALSETLLEGELFGHEKGAFTGAIAARPGLFEAADGGTLFLDEIGEIAPTTQAKLLRVLEQRSVTRLGARQARPIDVRFVAATNRDLEAEIREGHFRSDLYFRLNGMSLTIPPLRERPTDIDPLVWHFVRAACRQIDRRDPIEVSEQALDLLRRYTWPGNVRELKNVIDRAVVLCPLRTIGPAHLPASLVAAASPPSPRARSSEPPHPPTFPNAATEPVPTESGQGRWHAEIKALERLRLQEALTRCAGNQTQAAKLLGISRRTLVSRLSEYGMPRPRKRVSD